jgi:putative transcription factor
MYDEIEELATDYDERIRTAREQAGLTQDELAKQLNEKASLIRKIEHGDTLPSDDVQTKLERNLNIDLTTSSDSEDNEWDSENASDGYTLGDVVERNDS